ncbi:hypothetical protein F5Y05DRAFT_363884 [Hypoxylon sp. FL0543]|nr:hypothetical protein F5Y05DRAFT_363884 [Hypoxylon sp. FL0543]
MEDISQNLPEDRGFMPAWTTTFPKGGPPPLDIHHPKLIGDPLLTFLAANNGGVLYTMVYYSCCIVAGNCWNDSEGRPSQDGSIKGPYLSVHRDSNKPAFEIPKDGIIRGVTRLYFHVPNDKDVGRPHDPELGYAITPCFEHWVFPDTLPKPWRDLPEPESSPPSPLQGQCCLSGNLNVVTTAYMIPRECRGWFNQNDMRIRVQHLDFADSHWNRFTLRRDLRTLFDQSVIVPFPKSVGNVEDSETQLFACVVMPPPKASQSKRTWELIYTYHNRRYRGLPWVPRECVFARFAWSIFCTRRMLLFRGWKRRPGPTFYLSLATEQRLWDTKDVDFPWPRTDYSTKSGLRKSDGSNKRRRIDDEESDSEPKQWHDMLQRMRGVSSDSEKESESEAESWHATLQKTFGVSSDSEKESESEAESMADQVKRQFDVAFRE